MGTERPLSCHREALCLSITEYVVAAVSICVFTYWCFNFLKERRQEYRCADVCNQLAHVGLFEKVHRKFSRVELSPILLNKSVSSHEKLRERGSMSAVSHRPVSGRLLC